MLRPTACILNPYLAPMNREILRLAVPNVLSNISVPLLSSFDTILMGQLSGAHIAAVGLGSMAFNFVYWNFGFLRMSTTGLTAQAYGREDARGQAAALGRAALLALGISLLLLVFQYPFAELTHWLLNLRANQIVMVDEYFYTRLLAAPAALLLMVLFGWFFGRQNAVVPLILTLIINLGNMVVSYYLVTELDWGISGVAWGTVMAQYIGLACALVVLLATHYGISLKTIRAALRPDSASVTTTSLKDFFNINRDIFIRTVCLTLSFVFFYNRANALDVSTAVVAANVILLQLVNWLSYGVDGFAFAAESLVGKYHGAGNPTALQRAIRLVFYWGMGLAALYALVYYLGDTTLLQLFAPENTAPETLEAALYYLPLVVAFCILATPCYLFDGIYVGLTAAKAMRQTMILAFAAYLLTYYLFGQFFGNWGLWLSLLLFMVYRAGMQWWWMKAGRV
jgi:MATE family multidrug resistance protein